MNEKTDIVVPDKGDEVPSCANCFFSEKTEMKPVELVGAQVEVTLLCRRYPPTVVMTVSPMGKSVIGTVSPPVQPADWCGEHEPTHAPLIEH